MDFIPINRIEKELNRMNEKRFYLETNYNQDGSTYAAVMERKGYNKLDLNKLNYSEKTVSSKEALHDVIPVQWSPEVLNGEKKAVIKKRG